jgi:hypothetical protein
MFCTKTGLTKAGIRHKIPFRPEKKAAGQGAGWLKFKIIP